ncbi:MAG: GspE/PulE family protein [Polyangiaceae bacterium]
MQRPPSSPVRSVAAKPPSVEDLLSVLVSDGVLSRERAAEIAVKKDAVQAKLAAARRAESGSSAATPVIVTAVDVILAFQERDPDERPLREDYLTEKWSNLVGLPYFKLDPLKLDPAFTTKIVSKPFARKNGYLAIDEVGGALRIATFNPFDKWALDSVQQMTGKRIELVIASRSDIERLITEFYGFRQSVQRAEKQISQGVDLGNLEQLVRMKTESEVEASDEHIVHAVDYMFKYAFGQRASDIHIEPKRTESVVRFRIDGALHAVSRVPKVVHNAFVNRLKMLSRLDIAEKRRPQDGRIKTEFDGKAIDIRVSTLPVAFGEKLVLRIFDPAMVGDDLGALGFLDRDKRVFEDLIKLPHGIILVTGPTGSGKTTTLYTALRKLATEDVNITTIEDPIENVFEGINQTAINPAINLGFAEVLRTILRQDPDIIMVGEIRDLDTAKYAIQAALTGHLVFSTLHTNDAASAITRLLDLGVQEFLLSSTLVGVMAQRLVKLVCTSCAVERTLTLEEASSLGLSTQSGDILVRAGAGCADCRKTGHKGRSSIIELFRVTPGIRQLIHDRAEEAKIKAEARLDGMLTLREAAVARMLQGATSYEQVIEVTTDDGGAMGFGAATPTPPRVAPMGA